MANSSDWIARLQESALEASKANGSWIDALPKATGFVEGLPAMRTADTQSQPVPDSANALASQLETDAPLDPIEDAFSRGQAAGRAAALSEIEAEQDAANKRQRALRLSFQDLDQAAMDCLANDLAETVIGLCEQAFAQYVPDPDTLTDRCKEAAKRLGGAAQNCALHLNPDDIDLVDPETRAQWRVAPDDTLSRGGLRFEGPDGAICDGPAEWRRAIAAAIRG